MIFSAKLGSALSAATASWSSGRGSHFVVILCLTPDWLGASIVSLRVVWSVVVEALNKFCYWYFFCIQCDFNFKTSAIIVCSFCECPDLLGIFLLHAHSTQFCKGFPRPRCNPQQYSHSTISTAHIVHRVLSAFLCPPLADLRGKTFMATKRGLRRKMCTGKVGYISCDDAKAAL